MTIEIAAIPRVAQEALASNWVERNMRCFADQWRHDHAKRSRRGQLREWVAVVRITSDPANAPYIERRLRNAGPLKAHDLRNRVILAGLDRLLANH